MDYVVLDFEFTDNESKEIIEIGAVKINEQLQVIDKYQSFVKPLINTKLSWFIKKLTNIQQEDIENARHFSEVYNEFSEWVRENSLIITWGTDDKKRFLKDLNQNDIKSDLPNKFVNIQGIVSAILLSENEVGLKKTLEILNIEQEGEAHRALDDALNTSKIFVKLYDMLGDLTKSKSVIHEINSQVRKSNYKINYRRYKHHLQRLSIEKLENKLEMLNKIIEQELKKIKTDATYLYVIVRQKYLLVKETLLIKKKRANLQSEGIKFNQLETFIKNANMLYTLKDCLIYNQNTYTQELKEEARRTINKLRKISKKFNKIEFSNIKRENLVQCFREIVALINKINNSSFAREKYKNDLRCILNRSNEVLKQLDSKKISKEAS